MQTMRPTHHSMGPAAACRTVPAIPDVSQGMKQHITGFHQDEEQHWVAELACGHFQHMRHNPPWMERPWVITEAGRTSMLGVSLDCRKCDAGAPPDKA